MKKTASRAQREALAAAKPAANRVIAGARKLGRAVSERVQDTTPRTRKRVAAAAAGLAVAAIAVGLMSKRKKKRTLFG